MKKKITAIVEEQLINQAVDEALLDKIVRKKLSDPKFLGKMQGEVKKRLVYTGTESIEIPVIIRKYKSSRVPTPSVPQLQFPVARTVESSTPSVPQPQFPVARTVRNSTPSVPQLQFPVARTVESSTPSVPQLQFPVARTVESSTPS
ncbi:hypothetical protein GMJAKD_09930 [Candidatus Electrothrix aarhusensis]